MNDLQVCCSNTPKPLPPELGRIKSIAFNGVYYTFLNPPCKQLIKYDPCTCCTETICASRHYTSLCYDCDDQVYWALADGCAGRIYKLDCNLEELGHILIKNAGHRCATGISYDCCTKQIWVSFSDCTAYVEKGCYEYTFLDNENECAFNKAILCCCECRLVAYSECGRQFIDLIRPQCYERATICVPKGFLADSMCIASCCHDRMSNCTTYCAQVLLLQASCHAKTFLMECRFACCGECPEEPCGGGCYPCCLPHHCHPGPPCPPKPCCQHSVCQIIESVALEEAAIAHILNAEGEKIQKVVAECANMDDLLAVNESVKQTVTRITQLEMQLFLKLDTLLHNNCLCGNVDHPCPPCRDCCDCCDGCECYECCEEAAGDEV